MTALIGFGPAWWKALRPFSFSIALVSCLLGVMLARAEGSFHLSEATAVLLAGLLFQAAVNLINDFVVGARRTNVEWAIFASGLVCLMLIAPLGLFLVSRAGPPLLWLGLLGALGTYFYTGEPINYKRRGLAVVLVFFLMGVLMISGSHFALAHHFSIDTVWIAIPISTVVSLLLLSNELRDAEEDEENGIRTLTVRIGYRRAVVLYYGLLCFAYASAIALWIDGLLPHPWFVLASLPAVRAPLRYLGAPRDQRRPLTPLTARFHLVFGLLFIATFI